MLGSLGRRVVRVGGDPVQRSDGEALLELLKTRDLYEAAPHPREDYDPARLKILQGVTQAEELGPRLKGEAAFLYRNFKDCIERDDAEVEALADRGGCPGTRLFGTRSCRATARPGWTSA